MMAAEILETLLRANLAAALAVVLALGARRPVRAWFGAAAGYATWAVVPVAALASLLPARVASDAGLVFSETTLLEAPPEAAAFDFAPIALAIWLVGVGVGVAALTIRQVRFVRALGRLSPEPGDPSVARAERAGVGPVVVGALSPKIVLPTDFTSRYTPEEQAVILAHETAHLKAGDTRANALIALMRCVGWFNPLIHLGAAYARLDQEFARDAAVAARFPDARRSYAEAMLKSQLAAGDVALGCGWTPRTAQLLKKRIAMLAKPLPSRRRRALGAVLAAGVSVFAGCAAWAGQPPRQAAAAQELEEFLRLHEGLVRDRGVVSDRSAPGGGVVTDRDAACLACHGVGRHGDVGLSVRDRDLYPSTDELADRRLGERREAPRRLEAQRALLELLEAQRLDERRTERQRQEMEARMLELEELLGRQGVNLVRRREAAPMDQAELLRRLDEARAALERSTAEAAEDGPDLDAAPAPPALAPQGIDRAEAEVARLRDELARAEDVLARAREDNARAEQARAQEEGEP